MFEMSLPYYDPNPYIVYSKKCNMIIARRDGHAISRNSSFFKKVSQNMLRKNATNEPESNMTRRRSTRIRNIPKRYEDYDVS